MILGKRYIDHGIKCDLARSKCHAAIVFFLMVPMIITACMSTNAHRSASDSSSQIVFTPQESISQTTEKKEPDYVDITIASVGDILIHNTVYMAAHNPATGSYDFNNQFKYVKPLLEKADLTIANLETTLAGPEAGYAGYPKFNTPDSIIDALKYSGIDILTAANNHRMDQGAAGFYRTIRVVRSKGLSIIGVRLEEKEQTYVLKNIKGVKTAFINFGYSYPLSGGRLSINGLILPVHMRGLLDTFDPQNLDQATESLAEKISAARTDGAELVVVCMHWGDEYHRLPNEFQKALAENITALGANVIFGGHPHVLQPAVNLVSPQNTKVPVYYSQGNFISDQRKETVNDVYTEQGIIAFVTFRVYKGKVPQVLAAEAIPTWVNKKIINNRFVYEIIPVQEYLDDKAKFPLLNSGDLERIKFCSETVKQLAAGLK